MVWYSTLRVKGVASVMVVGGGTLVTSFLSCRITGGQNSSVSSAWARCPQRRGFNPPLGTFSVVGIFPLELTWVQTPFPPKLLRMRV